MAFPLVIGSSFGLALRMRQGVGSCLLACADDTAILEGAEGCYSTLVPKPPMTFSHFSISALTKVPNSGGLAVIGDAPSQGLPARSAGGPWGTPTPNQMTAP
jgi:NADH:ubiquinone oxidoreductase subunit F (NADH-binding)